MLQTGLVCIGLGLQILGFPCSQFGNEEYGNAEEIKTKCLQKYGVKFPIFELVNVNGENTHPVFLYCKWNSEEVRTLLAFSA